MKVTWTLFDGSGARLEKIVLEKKAGESERHIALKIMAYALFREETGELPLRIEQGVGQRHKPDLVATETETGRVRLWIDCGQIETQRLGRIVKENRQAKVVVVKSVEREMVWYARAACKDIPEGRGRDVSFLSFGDDFIPAFTDLLRGTNDLAVSVAQNGDAAQVTLNGISLPTSLHRLAASDVEA